MAKRGRIEYYKDHVGEFRVRFIAPNGEQIHKSSEGYKTIAGAINSVAALRRLFSSATTITKNLAAED